MKDKSINYLDAGAFFRLLLSWENISQAEFSRRTGWSEARVSAMARGKTKSISIDNIKNLCKVLGIKTRVMSKIIEEYLDL